MRRSMCPKQIGGSAVRAEVWRTGASVSAMAVEATDAEHVVVLFLGGGCARGWIAPVLVTSCWMARTRRVVGPTENVPLAGCNKRRSCDERLSLSPRRRTIKSPSNDLFCLLRDGRDIEQRIEIDIPESLR